VLLGSGECEQIAEEGGAKTEASLCYLARGEGKSAVAVIADAKDENDPILKALRSHALASSAFFDEVPAGDHRTARRDR
jgi:hypothetical protein